MPRRDQAAGARRAALPLDLSRIVRTVAFIVVVMLLNKLGTAGSVAFFAVLTAMIAYSSRTAFQALAICGLALMINIAFVPKPLVWTPGRLVLPILAMVRFTLDYVTNRGTGRGLVVYGALLAYIFVMAVCSVMSGWYTHIALLKLFNFGTCMTAIWLGTMVLRARRIDLSEWFVSLATAACAIGVLAIVLGVSTNFQRGDALIDSAFVGAFSHPNAHAVFASLFVTFLSSVGLYSPYRSRWLVVPTIGIWLLFMAWSASRTSFVASALGLVVLAMFARNYRGRSGRRLRSALSRGMLLSGATLGIVGLVTIDLAAGGVIWQRVVTFVNKTDKVETLAADMILRSRQGLIDHAWQNFLENPVFGIGFQVAKTESFVQNATLFSAPAEKGFLPTALLEEGGVLGASVFAIFLCVLVGSLVRERNVPALATLATVLGANLTEVSLLSPGGAGLFIWTMVGAAIILGDHCWTLSTPQPAFAAPPASRPKHVEALSRMPGSSR